MTLEVPGADGAAQLTALRAWLVSDSALRGRVDWVRRPPEPGQMGGVLDTLGVVLGGGGLASVLTPLCTWVASRRGSARVVVQHEGRRIEIDIKRAADPVAAARELLAAAREQGSE
ncbi:effector-associated constant component EACC1 [Streptomyces sp. 8L]|uniref:effector-associated constant component EACC1 n=1 Tax=Streptomyces sp. 8L TaxID=2877242 RepID=UPI001CD72DA0|nr:hypothetical protein [Streptomyces sp. 8L]MCA1219062.1 hypothetical protein [Streptomyces sp. 8L]